MNSKLLHKLVHLDLKGAPPKVSYYEWFFDHISKLGATGLLVEYEDTFPYHGSLEHIKINHAYSREEIQLIQEMATKNNLIIVPLVQTFGHLEFLLKHKEFKHLSEGKDPFSICATSHESQEILKVMIEQVLEVHHNTTYFHIGADEVFQLGECEKCQRVMKEEGKTKANLFLGHVTRLLTYLRERYPEIKWIMWDDMLRQVDVEVLKDSGIGAMVEPMVWSYTPSLQVTPATWKAYSTIFPSYWAASAFKGATGVDRFYTDIQYHVTNHMSWLAHVSQCHMRFSGIALTGWQRYTHFHSFCELLPTSIPSLTICLLILQKGEYTDDVRKETEKLLNFSTALPLNPCLDTSGTPQCTYPGSDLYKATMKLLALYRRFEQVVKTEKHLFNQEELSAEKESILQDLSDLAAPTHQHLTTFFPPDTAKEWVAYHIESLRLKWDAIVM